LVYFGLSYFKTKKGSFLPRDAMLARYMLSSSLFVRHQPALYQSG